MRLTYVLCLITILCTHSVQGIAFKGLPVREVFEGVAAVTRSPHLPRMLRPKNTLVEFSSTPRASSKTSSFPSFALTCLGVSTLISGAILGRAHCLAIDNQDLLERRLEKWYASRQRNISLLNDPETKKIFFIGNTGAGKSTTIAALLGLPLKKELNGGGTEIVVIDSKKVASKDKVPEIGSNTAVSQTTHLDFFSLEDGGKKNLVFIDTPGMKDTAGETADLTTQISLVDAFNQTHESKLVVIFSHDELTAARGDNLKSFCKTFATLVDKDAAPSILWVCTKSGTKTKKEVLWGIKEQHTVFARLWASLKSKITQAIDPKHTAPPEDPESRQLWERARTYAEVKDITGSITEKNLFLLDPMDKKSIWKLREAIEGEDIPSSEKTFFSFQIDKLKQEFQNLSDSLISRRSTLVFRRKLYADVLKFLGAHDLGELDSHIRATQHKVAAQIASVENQLKSSPYVYDVTQVNRRNSWGGKFFSWTVATFAYNSENGLFLDPPEETVLEGTGYFQRARYDIAKGVYHSTFTGSVGSDTKVRVRLKTRENLKNSYLESLEEKRGAVDRLPSLLAQGKTNLAGEAEKKRLQDVLSRELVKTEADLHNKKCLYECLAVLRNSLGIQSQFDPDLKDILDTQSEIHGSGTRSKL